MFINNIDPVLLNLGPFEVRYYGLVYAIGFLCVYWFLHHSIKKGRLGINENQLDTYMIFVILGSILGARLFEVLIYNFGYYMNNPSDIIRIWDGGMSYHGGIIGCVLVTYLFAKKHKVKFYEFADLIALPACLFLAIGKLANYTNSELYGKATTVNWCVVFQRVDDVCRHPVQIYESISLFIIFGILLYGYLCRIKHASRKSPDGGLFWTFMLLYSITRFIITFFRDEPLTLGLNVGQWASLVLMGLSIYFLWKLGKNSQKK
ncbi:MAG TPA: prolipoprotein diacylglyceryl transferase [Alphaproteobacteria bacterium]|nr:prolipoprotein diacylglyceryl transferase [Alphaproteobacteria bacterium]